MLYPTYITYVGTGRTGLIFRYSFFPRIRNSWNHLSSFNKSFVAFLDVSSNPLYGVHDLVGVK